MEIKKVKIENLKPSEYNPRKISKSDREQLKKSLKKFDFVEPIVVNKNKDRKNVIIGGHQRYKVAKSMGISELPCVFVDLNLEDEKELNLRLNKNNGEFDKKLLADLDKKLLADVGFIDKELDNIFIDYQEEIPEEEFTTEIMEENNYLVFVFDNSMDWLPVVDHFGIKKVHAKDSKNGYERAGTGRVLSGQKLLDLMNRDEI